MVVGVLVAACSSSSDAPSCQEAIGHYYSAGCSYFDTSGSPIAQGTIEGQCVQAASSAPSECISKLNAWLECNDSVPDGATTNAQCDCSQTFMAVVECN